MGATREAGSACARDPYKFALKAYLTFLPAERH
jgi:hypothetical protein